VLAQAGESKIASPGRERCQHQSSASASVSVAVQENAGATGAIRLRNGCPQEPKKAAPRACRATRAQSAVKSNPLFRPPARSHTGWSNDCSAAMVDCGVVAAESL